MDTRRLLRLDMSNAVCWLKQHNFRAECVQKTVDRYSKPHREVLIAMAEIVLEVIALILERIECFIFDAPTRPRPLHEPIHCTFVDTQIGHPTEMLDFPFG